MAPLFVFVFSSVNLKFQSKSDSITVKSAWYKSRCVIFHLTTTKERVCVWVRSSCFFKWFSVTQQGVDLHVALQKCCWSRPLQQAGSKIRKYRELGYVSWKPAYAVYSQQWTSFKLFSHITSGLSVFSDGMVLFWGFLVFLFIFCFLFFWAALATQEIDQESVKNLTSKQNF